MVRVLAALLLLLPSPALACLMADQYRLLPLGMSGDKLVLLELDQYRDSKGPAGAVFWTVHPRLVTLGSGQRSVVKEYSKLEVMDGSYKKDLAPVLKKVFGDAKKLNGFKEARVQTLLECHFKDMCFGYAFEYYDKEKRAVVRDDKISTPLAFPVLFTKHANAFWVDEEDRGKVTDQLIKKKYPALLAGWKLGTVRIYRVNKKHITVFHLGTGDLRFGPCLDCEQEKKRPGTRASRFLYNEPIPHHGASFDLLRISG